MRGDHRVPAGRSGEAVGGILIGLASLQFGFTVIFGDILQERGLPVFSMLTIRFGLAALLLAALLAALRRPLLPARGERVPLAVLGVAGYAVEAALFFAAIQRGEVAAVTLLFFTYPVHVTVASVLLGRGFPTRLVWTSLVCAMAGITLVLVTSGGLAISGIGALFALLSALIFAAYLLGADTVLEASDSMSGAMWVAAWASAGLLVFGAASGTAEVPDANHWWPLLGMAGCTAGAFFCLFAGLVRIGPVRTSIIAATEPLSATLLAAIFLAQPIRAGVAVGGVLILVGAVAASLARARPRSEGPPRADAEAADPLVAGPPTP